MKTIAPQSVSLRLLSGKRFLLLTCLFLVMQITIFGQTSSLVYMNGGSLAYTPFAMEVQTNAVNTIPDFSFCGYMRGGVAIPDLPVRVTLTPSGGDDTPAIQAAIDFVEGLPADTNGYRGAVLLAAGCYQIDQLFIEEGGVVLRGEGQGLDGTVLNAMLPVQHDVISIRGGGSGLPRSGSSRQDITSPFVAVGSYSFTIANASGYSVGDSIVIQRTPNQLWIDTLGMDQTTLCGADPGCSGWTPGSYTIYHERIITGIFGDTITIDLPVVDAMGAGPFTEPMSPGESNTVGSKIYASFPIMIPPVPPMKIMPGSGCI